MIAMYAPPKLRYQRISERESDGSDKDLRFRNFTREEARSRDYAEIENMEKGGPIAMADYLIKNVGVEISEIQDEIDIILEDLGVN